MALNSDYIKLGYIILNFFVKVINITLIQNLKSKQFKITQSELIL